MLVFSAKAASPFRTTLSEPKQLRGGVCSMTAKQILDAFSETLMQDEGILSPRERELLTSLLQNSKTVSGTDQQTQSAVAAAIAQSVGETVAQRAFALLGGSIVEQILAGSAASADGELSRPAVTQFGVPQPPSRPLTVPQPPSGPRPLTVPQPPSGPQGIRRQDIPVQQGSDANLVNSGGGVEVMEAAPNIRSQCVVLDEFLAPHEMDELFAYALQHEAEFQSSEVIAPSGEAGGIDYLHR